MQTGLKCSSGDGLGSLFIELQTPNQILYPHELFHMLHLTMLHVISLFSTTDTAVYEARQKVKLDTGYSSIPDVCFYVTTILILP